MGKVVFTCVVALALLGPPVAAAGASGTSGAQRQPVAVKARLLEVPFVPQSEALCGGAAAAMVFRYWRASPAYAEDFASLVDESAEGIRLGELTRAIQDRGWRAVPFAGTASNIQQHLARGRPIIALIEDRPGRHHYVVVVAWTTDQIVVHDPARGPFRVIDRQKFERVWAVTNRIALLILPESDLVSGSSGDPEPLDSASGNCSAPLEEAIQLARDGDLDAGEALLSLVAEACPGFSGALRELAGIRFLQKLSLIHI